MRPWLLLALAAMALVAAAGWPLLTYSLSLAVFGLAHVAYELRYVDQRFGQRLGRRLRWTLGALLAALVGSRALLVAGWISPQLDGWLELSLGGVLALSVVPALWTRSVASGLLAASVGLLILVGMALSPMHVFLAIAVLHNLSPLGFLAEALEGGRRRRALSLGALVFLGGPLLLATGLPAQALGLASLGSVEATLLPTGPLGQHLGVFLPVAWHARPWAAAAFSGLVFAQCMHYVAVIEVLPRLGVERRPVLRWPAPGRFAVGVVGASLVLMGFYAWSFGTARSVYGVAATLHAWIEIPLLLLALGLSPRSSA